MDLDQSASELKKERMTPLTLNQNIRLERRADLLALEMLSLQLNILQVFMPMDYWLVARQLGRQLDVVAGFGNVDIEAASPLLDALAANWPEAAAPYEFSPRAFGETDWKKLQQSRAIGLRPLYGFKAALQHHGQTAGIVAGFSTAGAISGIDSSAHAGEIALCLKAITQTLSLRGELAAAERLVLETQQDAQMDALTKILNRTGWNNKLRDMADTEADVAIGFVDLDLLKSINDNHGHCAGDELLSLTAQTIKTVLRANDCVARLGGDEFAIMLPDVTAADAAELKGRLKQALDRVNIRASIGVALKSEAGTVHDALRLADARMYEEKRAKRPSAAARNFALNASPA